MAEYIRKLVQLESFRKTLRVKQSAVKPPRTVRGEVQGERQNQGGVSQDGRKCSLTITTIRHDLIVGFYHIVKMYEKYPSTRMAFCLDYSHTLHNISTALRNSFDMDLMLFSAFWCSLRSIKSQVKETKYSFHVDDWCSLQNKLYRRNHTPTDLNPPSSM